MYKAVFKIQPECIDPVNQEIFTPFINCYQIHSVMLNIGGLIQEQDIDFEIDEHKTKWLGNIFGIHSEDSILFDINYFYIKPENVEVLGFLINETYSNPLKTKEIISRHYIDGQFSLDNGLYKNAALNFGTVLEGLLNKTLSNKKLEKLIDDYSGTADKEAMHFIRNIRNKVHPNRISNTEDVSRLEAIQARDKLEIIINEIKNYR